MQFYFIFEQVHTCYKVISFHTESSNALIPTQQTTTNHLVTLNFRHIRHHLRDSPMTTTNFTWRKKWTLLTSILLPVTVSFDILVFQVWTSRQVVENFVTKLGKEALSDQSLGPRAQLEPLNVKYSVLNFWRKLYVKIWKKASIYFKIWKKICNAFVIDASSSVKEVIM